MPERALAAALKSGGRRWFPLLCGAPCTGWFARRQHRTVVHPAREVYALAFHRAVVWSLAAPAPLNQHDRGLLLPTIAGD
jgi:hypothetical protein